MELRGFLLYLEKLIFKHVCPAKRASAVRPSRAGPTRVQLPALLISSFPLQVATPRTSVLRALALGKAPGLSSTRSEAPRAGLPAHSGLVHTSLCCLILPAPAVSIPPIIHNHLLLHCASPFLPALTQRTPKLWESHHPHQCGCRRGHSSPATRHKARAPETSCSALPIRRDACSAVPCRATEQAINIKANPRLASLESLFPILG